MGRWLRFRSRVLQSIVDLPHMCLTFTHGLVVPAQVLGIGATPIEVSKLLTSLEVLNPYGDGGYPSSPRGPLWFIFRTPKP